VIGTDANNATDFRKQDYDMKKAIVIGSEGNGIRDLVLKNCDIKVFIPMSGTVTSLNASVAAALIVYESQKNKL
jgi:23S rRNA (guanosine2251-2'-O)-methyltransferase